MHGPRTKDLKADEDVLDDHYYADELQDICKREVRKWEEFCLLNPDEIRERLQKENLYQEWEKRYYMSKWILKE